jgi:hypothetical protein
MGEGRRVETLWVGKGRAVLAVARGQLLESAIALSSQYQDTAFRITAQSNHNLTYLPSQPPVTGPMKWTIFPPHVRPLLILSTSQLTLFPLSHRQRPRRASPR